MGASEVEFHFRLRATRSWARAAWLRFGPFDEQRRAGGGQIGWAERKWADVNVNISMCARFKSRPPAKLGNDNKPAESRPAAARLRAPPS